MQIVLKLQIMNNKLGVNRLLNKLFKMTSESRKKSGKTGLLISPQNDSNYHKICINILKFFLLKINTRLKRNKYLNHCA